MKDCNRSRGPLLLYTSFQHLGGPFYQSETTDQARTLSVTYIWTHIVLVAWLETHVELDY